MNPSNPLLKAAVIASSVLLVAGLIAYRAGAFDWFLATGPTTMGGSKVRQVIDVPAEADPSSPDAAGPTPIIMSGSKSIPGLVPATPNAPSPAETPPATQKQSPTIMPGSKSSEVITPVTPPGPSGF
jgi:hypothetical protein